MLISLLERFRACIRENRYVVTVHAAEEMDEDDLSIFDIERVILTGSIIERQKDRHLPETKYLIQGKTV